MNRLNFEPEPKQVANEHRDYMRETAETLTEMTEEQIVPDPSCLLLCTLLDLTYGEVPFLVKCLEDPIKAGVKTSKDLRKWWRETQARPDAN